MTDWLTGAMGWLRETVRDTIEFLAAWTTVFCVWLADTILALGYPGIVFLMALESCFIPFPSEIVMPPAGFQIYEGNMAWIPVIVCGTAGSLLGALLNYYLAWRFGRPFFLRYGRYFFIREEHIDRTERFFAAHGAITTFVGRLIPGVRQLISLPAGLSRMPLGGFCVYTLLGSGIWVTTLTIVGWLVGKERDLLHEYLRDASLWALGLAALVVLLYVKVWRARAKRAGGDEAERG